MAANKVSTALFWNTFYERNLRDEWYISSKTLVELVESELVQILHDGCIIVHLGCGCSNLAQDLTNWYQEKRKMKANHLLLWNMDFSRVVLHAMHEKPNLGISKSILSSYDQMDVRKLMYRSGVVDLILDKGTIDR